MTQPERTERDRPASGPPAPVSGPEGRLDAEVRALRQELAHLRRHRMVMLYQSVPRVLLFKFATGMAVGLGTVIGATVLLSLIIWLLSQIEFIPIVGEWAIQVRDFVSDATGPAD
jgi:hypothetical protein